jgi:3-hydroxyisobutyrate dehydrogenase-like beta-hydroxyacid dehydrogenase
VQRGVRELPSSDLDDDSIDAVLVCLADDRSVLDIAAPHGGCRPTWARALVASTATISPAALIRLRALYGDRFAGAPIIGAPQAVRSGAATFIIGGGSAARSGLAPVWAEFSGPWDVGDDPCRASVVKLLHNSLLLSELTVVAETARVGRLAGLDDTTLKAVLKETPMLPAGCRTVSTGCSTQRTPAGSPAPLQRRTLSS